MFSEDLSVRAVQEESLTAMKYFHSLCTENNIHYSVHAGTMLGAVREEGFIPWDDDVDLTMTREEYKKWQKLMKSIQLDEYYTFDDTTYQSPRLCLHRPDRPLVWLTIFVYDYISERVFLQKIKTYIIAIYYIMLSGHSEDVEASTNRGLKAAIISMIRFFGKHRNKEQILLSYNRFCETHFTGNRTLIQRSNDRYCDIGIKKVLPCQYMSEYKMIPFEDIEVEISKDCHNILVSSYGQDYMTPRKDDTKDEMHLKIRNKLAEIE